MGRTSNRFISSWAVLSLLLGTASGTPSFSVTPSSPRISSGTVLHMGCQSNGVITKESSYNTGSVSPQFTADASMTGAYKCCVTTTHSHSHSSSGNYYSGYHDSYTTYTNSTTCSTTHVITVVPKTPVLFSTSTRLEFGESITLICDADERAGPPVVKYKFMHNSAELHTGITRHFTFTANGKSNGTFTCMVLADTHISGTVSSPQSPQVSLTVHMSTPPVLETTNSSPTIGESVRLTCKVPLNSYTVQASLMYRFLMNSSVIHSGSNAMFSFTGNAQSTGDYSCILFDGTVASQQSQPISITPHVPTPALQSTHRRPLSNDLVTLTCSVTLPLKSVVYKFMQDSVVIQTGTNNRFTFNATIQSSGEYSCMAIVDIVASKSSTPPLTISVTPTTTRRPIPFACETGANAVVDYTFIYDPEQYIHCTPDGKAYIETCPQGTLWDQAVRKCAAPSPPIG